ncbi:MAG: MBL fold metallo-hydrolase [Gemmatimonadota bacterium]
MRLTFLGTGTSFGVPVVGCSCPVCTSADPRNRRSRHGLLVEDGDTRLLVDTPPELRLQLLAADVSDVSAVFISHPHADHVHGIDDLRAFTAYSGPALPVFLAAEYEQVMRERFPYFWGPGAAAGPGSSIPELDLTPFEDRALQKVGALQFRPIGFPHGPFRSYGFRTGELGVIVDAKSVPEDAVELLEGVRVLVINALWWGNPHPSHFSIEEAVEVASRLGAERTFLTHLTHRVEHADLADKLPPSIEPAHDGLVIEV